MTQLTFNRLEEIGAIVREVTGYNAVVAGGAVRDLLHGNPIKDIDVFIEKSRDEEDYTDSTYTESLAKKVAKAFDSYAVTTSLIGYEASSEGDTYATFDIEMPLPMPPLNLIFVADIEAALNEFPDTISQVWLDGSGKVVFSDGHQQAVQSQVIQHTLRDDDERAQKRLRKLEGKFPNFKFEYVAELPKVSL